jgi:hypothetical protein
MEIRSDFQPVSLLLNRLIEYAKAFRENFLEHWPNLKNKEDFERVYSLESDCRRTLEKIYSVGRELAGFMSESLVEFNYSKSFPTLKSFVDSFKGGWIYQIDKLENLSQAAKNKYSDLDSRPWAVGQMIILFDDQIKLLLSVKKTIEGIKEIDIYKWENGNSQLTIAVPEYSIILERIHTTGKMLERHPATYKNKDEESLRDHFLVSLGPVVPGSATGETFNKQGKTDILIRNANSNQFIGECKFWHGEKAFLETISQLLKYLTWRDTKAAIILFVPNSDFTDVIRKMKNFVSKHPNYLKLINEKDETWFNYEFKMNEDKMRRVNVAIMLFHLPKSTSNL